MPAAKTEWEKNLWKMYEDAVHRLLSSIPGAVVEKHPIINGRNFDFSVTAEIAIPFSKYFEARLPITFGGDCKLHSKPIGLITIDAFRGMLEDAGLQNGILVSDKKFGKGALRRAAKSGIIPLRLPWDMVALTKHIGDTDDLCDDCPAADEDSMPGMIYWQFENSPSDGSGFMSGQCNKCGIYFIFCFDCGAKTGFLEGDYDNGIECNGGCGRIIVATDSGRDTVDVSFESYDSLETSVMRESFGKAHGLSDSAIQSLIGASKWQYWTVGDPLIGLYERGLIKRLSHGVKLTSEGTEVTKDIILKARGSSYGW